MSETRKYILQLTLPNGQKMVASRIEDKFALVPLPENGVQANFIAWETPKEVGIFFRDLKNRNKEKAAELYAWQPEIIPVIITPVGMFPAKSGIKI